MAFTRRHFLKYGGATAGAAALAATYHAFNIFTHRPQRNVLLIVADAMRGDRLGYKRVLSRAQRSITPTLDTLAQEGVAFTRAYSPSSWTPVSIASTLYDIDPRDVGYGSQGIEVHNTTREGLVELLSHTGRYTACVMANDALNSPIIRDSFDRFILLNSRSDTRMPATIRNRIPRTSSPEVNRAVAGLMKKLRASRSYFLYVHYMDTHDPYFCPPWAFASLNAHFDPSTSRHRVDEALLKHESVVKSGLTFVRDSPLDIAMGNLLNHYDASVMSTDRSVRKLIYALEANGLLEDTLLIFAADHGEEFGDNEHTGPLKGRDT